MTETYKAISYAYPTSLTAKKLGFSKTGCWYVEQTLVDIEGSGQCRSFVANNCEGFASPTDPDLLALFNEYEGEPEPNFLRHGRKEILEALGL